MTTNSTMAAGNTPGRPAPITPLVADQRAALGALAQISGAFEHLPAACFDIGTVFPDELTISLHDSFTDFEVWRAALGMPSDAVEYRALTKQMNLRARGSFAGATVVLVGYAPPLPAGGERP